MCELNIDTQTINKLIYFIQNECTSIQTNTLIFASLTIFKKGLHYIFQGHFNVLKPISN